MTYGDFVDLVIEELGVDGTRRGLEIQRARWVRDAVVDLQRFIRAYREGHTTNYEVADLTEKGYAHLGTLPDQAKPKAFYTISTGDTMVEGEMDDPNIVRNRMDFWAWEDRQRMIDARYDRRMYVYTISPFSKQFMVHPLVNDETYLLLVWDGLKMDFSDGDTVPWPIQAAEAVAAYVLWKIRKLVDKRLDLAREEYATYIAKRLALWREQNEAQFADGKDEEYEDLDPTTPAVLSSFGAQAAVFLASITGLEGLTTAYLSAIPTTSLTANLVVQIMIGGILQTWQLQAGTSATGPGIQRPNDFDSVSNPRIWVQLS